MDAVVDTQAFARSINELLVLAALRSAPKHGYQIAMELEERSGGTFNLQHGTLYPILHRLEREGLIEGAWDEGGGRRRKEYVLTRAGRARLGEGTGVVREVFERLIALLGEGEAGLATGVTP
ncbi:MAG TPA: PadR family transcriptional regulator [Longimicrobiales bacterium]|nr:PadR family transcriptional regulator [Longimicrobiales bacterium]